MTADLVIRNCNVVVHDAILRLGIAVSGGRITALASESNLPSADKTIDAKGNYVLPGVIDPHSHIGAGYALEDDCRTETAAACAGGVTTFFTTMSPHMMEMSFAGSLVNSMKKIRSVIDDNCLVDMAWNMIMIAPDDLKEIVPLFEEGGVTSFKFYMAYKGREGEAFGVVNGFAQDDGRISEGMRTVSALGHPGLVMVHCENIDWIYTFKRRLIEAGRKDIAAWSEARPEACELEAISRVAYMSEYHDCPLYIPHVSAERSAELLAKRKALGAKIIAETCPHYLTLTSESAKEITLKVNPPLRSKSDVGGLWSAIALGTIDCIGSDHCNITKEAKTNPGLWDSIPDFPGTETMLPIMLSEGVNKNRISLEKLASISSYNTAKAFGLLPQKGVIQVGSDADFVVVDLHLEGKVRADLLHSASDFSPYEGMILKGWPVTTILRGETLMENGEIIGKKGFGKFLMRRPAASIT